MKCKNVNESTRWPSQSDQCLSFISDADVIENAVNCINVHDSCDNWAAAGECCENPNYMTVSCPASCKVCKYKNKFTLKKWWN